MSLDCVDCIDYDDCGMPQARGPADSTAEKPGNSAKVTGIVKTFTILKVASESTTDNTCRSASYRLMVRTSVFSQLFELVHLSKSVFGPDVMSPGIESL